MTIARKFLLPLFVIFEMFGIKLPAFEIAGGLILLLGWVSSTSWAHASTEQVKSLLGDHHR